MSIIRQFELSNNPLLPLISPICEQSIANCYSCFGSHLHIECYLAKAFLGALRVFHSCRLEMNP